MKSEFLLNEPNGFPLEAIQRLRIFGPVYRADSPYPEEKVTAVFVRLREKIGPEFHLRHPALRWIVSPTTGVDHLDLPYFEQAGVTVLCLRGRTAFLDHIHATAEHTLALVLALIRNVPAAVQHVKDGHWNRYLFQGRELFGKTVLILGYGRIGRQVHALYSAFGCRVIALDCIEERVPMQLRCNTQDAFAQADILSIHVNLDLSTKGLVGEAMLDRLKPGTWLVNTSRGEIVDQIAVIKRVEDGRLGGAALDVLNDEPQPFHDNDLQSAIRACGSKLIITPHIAGFTLESLYQVENFVTDLLLREIKEN
jgi:phosphoglycerate dehydrogenase-like enzyme